jgi:hypothetical protein
MYNALHVVQWPFPRPQNHSAHCGYRPQQPSSNEPHNVEEIEHKAIATKTESLEEIMINSAG